MRSIKKSSSSDWSVVAQVIGQMEAEIVAGRLRTAGIPSYIHQESIGRAFGLTLGPMGMVMVLVPVEYEREAIALLDEPTLDDMPPQIDDPPSLY